MKLKLLLLPLVPLSALGVVEIVDRVQPSTDPVCVMTEPPITQPHVAPRIATPVAPTPGPQPTVSL
jgi:hypothetical protein